MKQQLYSLSFILLIPLLATQLIFAQISANVTVEPVQNIYCYDDTITLTATVENGVEPYTLTWCDAEGNPICIEGCQATLTPPIPLSTAYTVKVSDANGATTNVSTNLNVSYVSALLESDVTENCYDFNNPTSLEVELNDNSTSTSNIVNYTITLASGEVIHNESFPPDDLNYIFLPGSVYTLNYTLTDEHGCTSSSSLVITNTINPTIGSLSTGSQGCAPLLVNIPISDIENNAEGTNYFIDLGNGEDLIDLGMNPDSIYQHTYYESSCGLEDDEYKVSLIACSGNCCSEISFGVEVWKPPFIDFVLDSDCGNIGELDIINNSIEGFNQSCNQSDDFVICIENICKTYDIDDLIHFENLPTGQDLDILMYGLNNPCISDSSTQNICLSPPLNPIFTISHDVICVGNTLNTVDVEELVDVCSPVACTWVIHLPPSENGEENTEVISTGDCAGVSYIPTQAGITTLELQAATSDGCIYNYTQEFEVISIPTVTLTEINDTIACDSLLLPIDVNFGNVNEFTQIEWLLDGTPISFTNPTEPDDLIFYGNGSHTLTVSVGSPECTGATQSTSTTFNVTINDSPNLTVLIDNMNTTTISIFPGESVDITMSGAGNFDVLENGTSLQSGLGDNATITVFPDNFSNTYEIIGNKQWLFSICHLDY